MEEQNSQPAASPVPEPSPVAAPTETEKPKVVMTDAEAQALLALNNLQAAQQPKTKPPVKLLVVAAVLIILVVLASYLLGAYKSGGKSTNLGIPNQSNSANTNSVNNQINQDVKTCSNPLNASLVC